MDLALPLAAQVVDVNHCVYREGDDPQWSRADYDDSTWSKAAPDFFNELPLSRFVWQRCGFNTHALPAGSPLFVQLNTPFALQLYLGGRYVGAIGNPETGESSTGAIARLSIPDGLSDRLPDRPAAPHRIAVRYTRTTASGLVALPFPAIGPSPALELRRFQIIRDNLKAFWLSLATAPFILAASLVLLILSGADPSRRAAFWFGVVAGGYALQRIDNLLSYLDLGVATGAYNAIYQNRQHLYQCRARVPVLCDLRKTAPSGVSSDRRVSSAELHLVDVALCLGRLGFLCRCLAQGRLVDAAHRDRHPAEFERTVSRLWPWTKIPRRNLPLFAASAAWTIVQWITECAQLPWIGDRMLIPLARTLQTMVTIPAILVFTTILAARMRRVHTERDELQAGMRAAQAVQQRLIPEQHVPIPGFRLETAYLPAKEVGGDFYQFLPNDDGSLLVVVGDVSGKGLDAAMLVNTMLVNTMIGALRNEDSREPAIVLARLNRLLQGNCGGGFVTCCCALFRSDGSVVVGPPLGIVDGVEYETTIVPAGSGTMTFLSDGVLEATDTHGEMLAFERLAALTVKPARDIASEAERWGQEDDITVVKVAYA